MLRDNTEASLRAPRHMPLRAGMTLIEMLIALAIATIALVIAMPAMTKMRSAMMVDAAAHQLAGDLHRARIEAIRRNAPMSLRKTSTGHYAVDSIGARVLPNNADFEGPPDSIRFASIGPPQSGAVTFVVWTAGSKKKSVSVNASGHVNVY